MGNLILTLAADWQEIDAIADDNRPENDCIVFGLWVNNEFISLDDFIRYGTPWIGNAPECKDENGNAVQVHGVYTDFMCPYFIELDSCGGNARLWREYKGGDKLW